MSKQLHQRSKQEPSVTTYTHVRNLVVSESGTETYEPVYFVPVEDQTVDQEVIGVLVRGVAPSQLRVIT